jgi:nitronate monooxygenase
MSTQPGLFSPLLQVVDAVRVPVIAAGGAADGRTAAAAFMLGASAVQIGTAFLRCEEADVRDAHRAALAEADDACTVVTDVISGRPCRYIRNKLIDDLVASGLKPPPVPPQQSLTPRLGDTGNREWTALTSGNRRRLHERRRRLSWSSGSPAKRPGGCAPSPGDLVPRQWVLVVALRN